MCAEHGEGNQLISAVVVNRDTRQPGVGFWNIARDLGLSQARNRGDFEWARGADALADAPHGCRNGAWSWLQGGLQRRHPIEGFARRRIQVMARLSRLTAKGQQSLGTFLDDAPPRV
jgi:hypothetical protein